MMNEEIKRDRSPNYPKMPLQHAIELVSLLHKKAGKSQLKPEVAASVLGYSGINGAALTTIGAINQYGLIDRTRGEGIAVSALALQLLHPLSDEQKLTSAREACLKPRVFNDLYSGGFFACAEDVLANNLIHQGFTTEGAKKAASVFKENAEYAKLEQLANKPHGQTDSNEDIIGKETQSVSKVSGDQIDFSTGTNKVLAKYSIPLGSNEATIVFTGETLAPEDFDALIEYVELFKKQFERKKPKTATEDLELPVKT